MRFLSFSCLGLLCVSVHSLTQVHIASGPLHWEHLCLPSRQLTHNPQADAHPHHTPTAGGHRNRVASHNLHTWGNNRISSGMCVCVYIYTYIHIYIYIYIMYRKCLYSSIHTGTYLILGKDFNCGFVVTMYFVFKFELDLISHCLPGWKNTP